MGNTNCEEIKQQAEQELISVSDKQALEALRVKYLGRKGLLAQLMSVIPSLPVEERAAFGQAANVLKNELAELFDQKQKDMVSGAHKGNQAAVDISMPGIACDIGNLHPITQVIDEICNVFSRMGFSIEDGPEIETEFNNFTGLNIPLDHPSRDAFDTFYLKPNAGSNEKLLLRSHTSPAQVRLMKSRKPALSVVVPGRVYRPDAVDASHSFMFHQVEGLVVDKHITLAHLKGALEEFAKAVFGKHITMRFRPHFFPFTEPSVEVDISCIICQGKGCSVCGKKKWLEILGAGMVHPNVFKHVGYNHKIYSGFAFGMGVERIAMLKYGIDDIRLFFENDLRFLKQF
ncbi:MAG: phenylalanine--tRNA ligase subunit alpha [Candidatus Omnitrophica bacterium]|jgi:phenylalanyl-tRNA synthetase alpha chain|nr:phenylalanine--tRNA ligase subunit alpha [Candidatus Omnitrophota bacterium]